MGLSGEASRRHFLDPEYWQPRLERLWKEPRQLTFFPRPDLSRPGIDVRELRLRAHDGARLTALLARSAFAGFGLEVQLRACPDLDRALLDWSSVEQGGSDLVFCYPPERKLEDRVLDVVRVVEAACSVESIDCSQVTFHSVAGAIPDEFQIVKFLREKGWIAPHGPVA
jgi:hypothetical protein